MPILHRQISGQVRTPDGTFVQASPPVALAQRGPCLQVTISLPKSIAEPLLQQGHTLPEPISGIALIDTGAFTTCIDTDIAARLQLPIVDTAIMVSASHAATQQNLYPVTLEIVGTNITMETNKAMGALLQSQGLIALIGRDMLQQCTLFYNGVTGQITLSI